VRKSLSITVRKRVQATRQDYHANAYLYARRQRAKRESTVSHNSDSFAGLPELDFLVQSLHRHRPDRSARVLDVGCGYGNYTIPLASLGYTITGIDIEPESIEKAKEVNPFPQATFRCADVEQLRDESFDVVVLTQVLEHVVDPQRFLRLLASRCLSGGILLLTLPNGYGPKELAERLYRRLRASRAARRLVLAYRQRMRESSRYSHMFEIYGPINDEGPPHVQRFTMSRLLPLLRDSGFETLEIQHCDILSTLVRIYLPFLPLSATLQRIDYYLADLLPPGLVSHWFIVCRRGGRPCGDDGA
jgi:2-polyprenyl-3-methyl-5-hydroxy-6-metoxy-1,4-benzoquinol methylase